jgi:glycosyltransferase involved in cell wall biosynthesis
MENGMPATGSLSYRERLAVAREVCLADLREWLEFDSTLYRVLSAWVLLAAGLVLLAARARLRALLLLTKLHRAAFSRRASRIVERVVRSEGAKAGPTGTPSVYQRHIECTSCTSATIKFFRDPRKLLGTRVLVLKSPAPQERGVLLLDYNYIFPLFAKLFDVRAIARRYHVVLEPSWSGFCNLDILSFSLFDSVFVQASEPRDAEALRRTAPNLATVPISMNWWIDSRVLRPLPDRTKNVGIITLSSWANFKRHRRLFAALNVLRRRGEKPRAILVGYPVDRALEDIARLARYYGVLDQLEFHEGIDAEQVNRHLNRARVNVVWSRREGVNRAVIEGLHAGTPCILREGFNYGYHYDFINDQTGCYAAEAELPDRLMDMIERYREYAPRDWVMQNMSCQRATELLGATIREAATARGERWTRDLAVKVAGLKAMSYWDPNDAARFRDDYEFLTSTIRPEFRPAAEPVAQPA